MNTPQNLIQQAYAAFNARDIPRVLATLHPQVRWAKAWEGDYATGHAEVRDYWQRQWQELDPHVEPTTISERADGRLEVLVQQLVKDRQGNVVFEGLVKHLYTLADGLLQQMDIEQVQP
jgi:ketosteroid isomerase-like protein